MLVKRSRKNQVAIPKTILERAGVGEEDVYFDVDCREGRIVLTPVDVEPKIPVDALLRFEEKVLKRGRGDRVYRSMDEAIRGLRRRLKKSRK